MKSALLILENARLFNTTPPFHAAGIGTMTFLAIWLGLCSVMPPHFQKPLDGTTVASALSYANASSMLVIPSVLDEMSKDSALSDALRNVTNVIWSGGALPTATGEKLKYKAKLISYIGAIELAIFPHLIVKDAEDWKYVAIDPCFNIQFRPQADNFYKAVVVRSTEYKKYQPLWHIFSNL